MTIDFERTIMNGILVDGDGDVWLDPDELDIGGNIELSISDIRRIHTVATAHRYAYQAYKNRDYEDDEKYKSDFDSLATM